MKKLSRNGGSLDLSDLVLHPVYGAEMIVRPLTVTLWTEIAGDSCFAHYSEFRGEDIVFVWNLNCWISPGQEQIIKGRSAPCCSLNMSTVSNMEANHLHIHAENHSLADLPLPILKLQPRSPTQPGEMSEGSLNLLSFHFRKQKSRICRIHR